MDDELTRTLRETLAATSERPVERTASRWLGEAEAIARDAAMTDLEEPVRRERLREVRELLANVEEPVDAAADDHVPTAEELLAQVLDAE
jgi:hypothetical protein